MRCRFGVDSFVVSLSLIFSCLCGLTTLSFATEGTAQTQVPATSQPLLQINGLIDFSYGYFFNNPGATSQSYDKINPGPVKGRIYDIYSNSFNLNLAEVSVKKTLGTVSLLLDLDFGTMADINATSFVASTTSTPQAPTNDDVSKHMGQAVVSWTPASASWLLIEAGKMPTHLGYEVMKAKDNWQYSRSMICAFGVPIWHTGLHVGATLIPEHLNTSLYLYNGINSIYDVNPGKTFGFQTKWTPNSFWTLVYNLMTGPEQPNSVNSLRTVHEANLVFSPTTDWAFAAEALTGKETLVLNGPLTDAKWNGVSLHAKWNYSESGWLSPRVEWYFDPQGYTSGSAMAAGYVQRNVRTYTLTQNWNLASGLDMRLEFRHDRSSVQDYVAAAGDQNSQSSLTAAVLYNL